MSSENLNTEEVIFLRGLGEKIKSLRKQQNVLQEVLAIKADISRNQLGRIERGSVNIKIITLRKIAKALEIDINSLLEP